MLKKQLLTYFLVGLAVALFQYLSFFIFYTVFGLAAVLASTLSFVLTVLVSYVLQKTVTFKTSAGTQTRKTISSLALFYINAVFGLVINGAILYVGVHELNAYPYLVQAIAMAILATYNFFIYRLILT